VFDGHAVVLLLIFTTLREVSP